MRAPHRATGTPPTTRTLPRRVPARAPRRASTPSSAALADGVSPSVLAAPPAGVTPAPPPPPTKSDAAFAADGVIIGSGPSGVSLDDLNDLFSRVGFPRRDPVRLAAALRHSHAVVWATAARGSRWAKEGQLLAFARATSDGALAATLWDVAVHPAWQKGGLGRAVVERATLAVVGEGGVGGWTLYAEPDVVGLYTRLGFVTDPQGVKGMAFQRKSAAGAALLARVQAGGQ